MFADEAEDAIVNEQVKLKEIPSLYEILGIHEGQIAIIEVHGKRQRYIIKELYDEILVAANKENTIQVHTNIAESMIENGTLILLIKKKKPVLGKRWFLFFGPWFLPPKK